MKWFNSLSLASCLTISSFSAYAVIEPLDRIAAIVKDDVVMQSQLEQRILTVSDQIRSRNSIIPPAEVLQSQVMERLILESIQLQLGERAGIRIDDKTLHDTLIDISKRNGMDLAEFKLAIEADGMSYTQAREQIRRDLLINRVRQQQVSSRIHVSDQEVRNFELSEEGQYQLSEDYHLAHILIALPDAASPGQIAKAKQKAGEIYQQLKDGENFQQLALNHSSGQFALEGGDLGWRKADQIPSLFASIVTTMKVDAIAKPMRSASGFHIVKLINKRGGVNHIQHQYDVRHILIKPTEIRTDEDARVLAQRIFLRLENGESFDDLSRSYSDDTGSALNGGSLEWVNPADLVPEFQQAMEETPHWVVSEPFKTQFGWHLLEVLGERSYDMSETVKANRIRNILHNRKFEQEVEVWLREIRDETYVEVKF